MADNETTQPPAAPEAPKGSLPSAAKLRSEANDNVKTRGAEPRKEVVARLADEIVAERSSLLYDAVLEREKMDKEFKKLGKPEKGEKVSLDGKEVILLSSEKVEKVKKAREKLASFDKAVDLAVNQNDYGKLKEMLGKKG